MEQICSNRSEAQDAPPLSGARPAPAPFLDKGDGNVPSAHSRPVWNRKQWATRRTVMDRLRYWQANGYQCLWVTLTSSPRSTPKRIRADFQALRKRMGRDFGLSGLEYVCVDTREGHGVLHMIWAWKDPDPSRRASFYVPFNWLQASWKALHGAFHVNVKRIGGADQDARRLSRYLVAQYCGGQNALVRLSQSRMQYPFTKMRTQLLRTVRDLPERYQQLHEISELVGSEEFPKVSNQLLWSEFRRAWDDLVKGRSCRVFGVVLVWIDGELRRL